MSLKEQKKCVSTNSIQPTHLHHLSIAARVCDSYLDLGNVEYVHIECEGGVPLLQRKKKTLINASSCRGEICLNSGLKPTYSTCVRQVGGVADRQIGSQLRVTGLLGKAHDLIVGLHVSAAGGERGAAVLGCVLEVALLFHLSPHGGVPVVLYSVVGPASHKGHVLT